MEAIIHQFFEKSVLTKIGTFLAWTRPWDWNDLSTGGRQGQLSPGGGKPHTKHASCNIFRNLWRYIGKFAADDQFIHISTWFAPFSLYIQGCHCDYLRDLIVIGHPILFGNCSIQPCKTSSGICFVILTEIDWSIVCVSVQLERRRRIKNSWHPQPVTEPSSISSSLFLTFWNIRFRGFLSWYCIS